MTSVDAAPSPPARLSPKVRRLLRGHRLAVEHVTGTGAGGRVTPDDVRRAAAGDASGARSRLASPLARRLLRDAGLDLADVSSDGSPITRAAAERAVRAAAADTTHADGHAREDRPAPSPSPARPEVPADPRTQTVPLSPARRATAERMHRSLRTTAQLTAVRDVDLTRLVTAVRYARAQTDVPLTPLVPIALATCRVLRRHPVLNASIDTDAGTATYHRDVDLDVVVDGPDGAATATVRNAHDLNVRGLAGRTDGLADHLAEPGGEHGGGTFTLNDVGARGVLLETVILEPGQVGVLAIGQIGKRPVVIVDEFGMDAVAVRYVASFCLTYDHRLVDGADAARFLADLQHQLEHTDLLADLV